MLLNPELAYLTDPVSVYSIQKWQCQTAPKYRTTYCIYLYVYWKERNPVTWITFFNVLDGTLIFCFQRMGTFRSPEWALFVVKVEDNC